MPRILSDAVCEHFFAGAHHQKCLTSFEENAGAPAQAVGQAPSPAPAPDARAAAEAKPGSHTPPEPPPPEVNEDILAGPEAVSSQAAIDTIPGGPGRPAGVNMGADHYGSLNTILLTLSAILVGLGLGYDHCMDAWDKYSGGQDKPASSRGSARSQGRQIGRDGSGEDGTSGSRASG
ncbi:unnamed protein product [Effrenium voratum]|uniref:Uncharacterized protein n=1 Tax=Effrenium voratum TaxID=2562239 RepID=A0AA36HU09_9DINO|nr:unnamed protein product [Effrenium voratum]CAJ1418849.1 unnamed protein product [Effrenium voratum]|mmetsp:Transcript_41955/g.99968  ORF Transcript_41955/g.99968 Transcript_41955/m.99968 type:complete len:177 (+) Transcript_41955:78-608(+)